MRLINLTRCGYASIVKRYPTGLGNRMRRFDEWSLTGNHPRVRTYYDYFYIMESEHLNLIFPESQASKSDIDNATAFYRPKLKEIMDENTFFDEEMIGDREVSVDIEKITLASFIRDGLRAETRMHIHHYALWLIITAIFCSVCLTHFFFYSDYRQQIVMVDPDPSFEHYNPNLLEY